MNEVNSPVKPVNSPVEVCVGTKFPLREPFQSPPDRSTMPAFVLPWKSPRPPIVVHLPRVAKIVVAQRFGAW